MTYQERIAAGLPLTYEERLSLRRLCSNELRKSVRYFRNEPRTGWVPPEHGERPVCQLDGCEKTIPPRNTRYCSQDCREAAPRLADGLSGKSRAVLA